MEFVAYSEVFQDVFSATHMENNAMNKQSMKLFASLFQSYDVRKGKNLFGSPWSS